MYRPLSPHLLIYKPQISSVFSIFHRITGSILAIAFILICLFIKFVTCHINYYPIYLLTCLLHTNLSWLIIAGLYLVICSFFYHLFNGIRHLIWDFSKKHWLDVASLNISIVIVLASTTISTILLYIIFGAI